VSERRRIVALPRGSWPLHLLLIAGAFVMAFPFYWMLVTSVKGIEEASGFPPTLWPSQWQWSNYAQAWRAAPFGRYFFNTLLVAGCQTLLVLVTSSLAAYALARIPFRGKQVVFVAFLATLMIPIEVILVPNFVILKYLGWYDTYLALIVPWGASVFAIFLLRQFFLSIPNELWDAAQIDGCGRFGFLWRIAVPMAKPALVTISLLVFHGAWNSLLWPLIVTGSADMRLLQVGLSAFQSDARVQYHLWMAAAAVAMVPMVIVFFIAQRYFIEGVAGSGLKG
jgi:multiple sugar transport system permease protein